MKKEVTFDTEKLYTKSEYARAYSMSRPKIDALIKDKKISTIKVKGTTLIIAK